MVANESVSFPIDLAVGRVEFSLNTEEWPNPTQIVQILVDLQAKGENYENLNIALKIFLLISLKELSTL
jgi:hypothetical protein